jgi:hypothetical protein
MLEIIPIKFMANLVERIVYFYENFLKKHLFYPNKLDVKPRNFPMSKQQEKRKFLRICYVSNKGGILTMKLRKIASVTLALTMCVAPAMGMAKDKSIGDVHHQHHNHGHSTSTTIDSLPKAQKFAPDKGPATIEKTTTVKELDEKGNVKATRVTEKNVKAEKT